MGPGSGVGMTLLSVRIGVRDDGILGGEDGVDGRDDGLNGRDNSFCDGVKLPSHFQTSLDWPGKIDERFSRFTHFIDQ